MVTLPRYDDQTFLEIMDVVKRRIPVIYPEWTDLNEHDPGITILELFAWLKEMQQYHLNRIPAQSYESMLKLLGVMVKDAQPARTRLAFPVLSEKGRFPCNMRLVTQGGIVFESENPVILNDFKITSIYVSDGTVFSDVKDMVIEPNIYCYAFGEKPVNGLSALYIGFDRLQPDMEMHFYFRINDSFPVPRNPFDTDGQMPREVLWEYGIAGEEGQLEFAPVEGVQDKTFGFSRSGELILRMAKKAFLARPGEELQEGCWLRARLIRKGCEENPRLQDIFKETVVAIQQETHSELLDYTQIEHSEEMICGLPTWLAIQGKRLVFIRDQWGWENHHEFALITDENSGERSLKLSQLPSRIAMDGAANIRILCYADTFEGSMILAGSNGLPSQSFPFQLEDPVLKAGLKVMVYEETDEGPLRWMEWSYVPKLSQAGPYDRCFTYDSMLGELVFGDNENGAVPLAGKKNIMVAQCKTTKGADGNISIQEFKKLDFHQSILKPINLYAAQGGRDEERTQDALERYQLSLKKCTRAITAADYDALALATPGLRVLGVRAIPFYDPDSKVAGDKQTPATVTIVALPYSEEDFPKPDKYFLAAIRSHLEKFRLITTNLKVIGPSYIKVDVDLELVVESNRLTSVELEVKVAVEAYFEGLRKGKAGGKPEFGQPVQETSLLIILGSVAGISYVKKVTLGVRSRDSYRDKHGSIVLPAHGLPYLGDLQIRTLI